MSKESVMNYFSRLDSDRDFRIKILESSNEEKGALLQAEGYDFTREEALEAIEESKAEVCKNPEIYAKAIEEKVVNILYDIKSTQKYMDSEELQMRVEECELKMVSGGGVLGAVAGATLGFFVSAEVTLASLAVVGLGTTAVAAAATAVGLGAGAVGRGSESKEVRKAAAVVEKVGLEVAVGAAVVTVGVEAVGTGAAAVAVAFSTVAGGLLGGLLSGPV